MGSAGESPRVLGGGRGIDYIWKKTKRNLPKYPQTGVLRRDQARKSSELVYHSLAARPWKNPLPVSDPRCLIFKMGIIETTTLSYAGGGVDDIMSFIHSFIEQICIESLLCAWPCARHWGHSSKELLASGSLEPMC